MQNVRLNARVFAGGSNRRVRQLRLHFFLRIHRGRSFPNPRLAGRRRHRRRVPRESRTDDPSNRRSKEPKRGQAIADGTVGGGTDRTSAKAHRDRRRRPVRHRCPAHPHHAASRIIRQTKSDPIKINGIAFSFCKSFFLFTLALSIRQSCRGTIPRNCATPARIRSLSSRSARRIRRYVFFINETKATAFKLGFKIIKQK